MKKRVIENMKENLKILFDYIKKQKIRDNKIGPFKRGKEYVYDIDEICKMLVEQYNAQFSKHININKVTKNEIEDISEGDLVDIQFDESDIANAINKLKKNSAAGPDGVPAILLINTKDAIKKPLQIILRKSIDEGVIPDIFKLAYITPIHKGGSKLMPENYNESI